MVGKTKKNDPVLIPTLEFKSDGTIIDSQIPWYISHRVVKPGEFVVTSKEGQELPYHYFETKSGELVVHPFECIDGYGCFTKYKRR